MIKHFTLFILLIISFSTLSAQTVTVGTGTSISAFSPIIRSYDYCLYEVIYQAADINMSGNIAGIGFQRVDGTYIDSIADVTIYMKQTSNTTMTAGTFDTTGYTRVFNGKWPNDAGSGWREHLLDSMFTYDNNFNLQVLIVKGYEPAVGSTPVSPRWYYTTSTIGTQARRYYGNSTINSGTNLSTTNFISNIRIQFDAVGTIEIANHQTQIYPNPSEGLVQFSFAPESDIKKLTVFNINGQQVLNTPVNGNYTLNSKNYTSGIYFYRLTDTRQNIIRQGKLILK